MDVWGEVIEKEGYEGVRKRSEQIFGRSLPVDYKLEAREFSRGAVLEMIKELRCRASDREVEQHIASVKWDYQDSRDECNPGQLRPG